MKSRRSRLASLLFVSAALVVGACESDSDGGGSGGRGGSGGSTGGRGGSGGTGGSTGGTGGSTGGSGGSTGSTGGTGGATGGSGGSTGGTGGTGGATGGSGGSTGGTGGGAGDGGRMDGAGDRMGDGGPSDTGGADLPAGGGSNTVGQRYSLGETLDRVWVGARRTQMMEGETKVYRGMYEANKIGGPNGHTPRLPLKPGKEYILEYKIRFDTGFDFSRGGKIPGLAGASAPTGCVSTNGSGFSARSMWRQGGALIGYTYDNNQSGACGNAISTSFRFGIGRWHELKQRVRLNTGRTGNGILQMWADGQMVINRSNLAYMNEAPGNKIDVILFHTFFGGSTQDWAPSRNVYISFSDVYATLIEE